MKTTRIDCETCGQLFDAPTGDGGIDTQCPACIELADLTEEDANKRRQAGEGACAGGQP